MLISRGITSSGGGQAQLEVSSDLRYSTPTLLNRIHTNPDIITVSRSPPIKRQFIRFAKFAEVALN